MSRFFPSAKRSLDSLLNLITDLAGDVLLFFRLPFRSRTALSAEVLESARRNWRCIFSTLRLASSRRPETCLTDAGRHGRSMGAACHKRRMALAIRIIVMGANEVET
jgi:hypothetical protein